MGKKKKPTKLSKSKLKKLELSEFWRKRDLALKEIRQIQERHEQEISSDEDQ